jgi:hypothetical protein
MINWDLFNLMGEYRFKRFRQELRRIFRQRSLDMDIATKIHGDSVFADFTHVTEDNIFKLFVIRRVGAIPLQEVWFYPDKSIWFVDQQLLWSPERWFETKVS